MLTLPNYLDSNILLIIIYIMIIKNSVLEISKHEM
jgi:hypothetical protein